MQASQHDVQEATILRGVRGLKLLFHDTLKKGKDYVVFGAPQLSLEIMGETFWKNYNLKREEQNIRVDMIFSDDLRQWGRSIKNKMTNIRFLPKQFDGLSETMIYGDHVAMIVWTEKPIATLIQDASLAESYRRYFQLLWKQAKN
ncbi:hypothetical protein HZB02_05980 [Candidatus Woesearchaeota archaeon]|nr:hypothetical protein [Candidatus Woesearchaeota archaeon]